jgi:hypothetical protein
MVPQNPKRLLSRWRMRFQVTKFGDLRCSMFAPGHAVLFRRKGLNSVASYDLRFPRVREDCDICKRQKNAGWEIHYIAESRCTSIQTDMLSMLSRKGLARGDWRSPADDSFLNVVMRLGRDLVKLRFYFWPIDIAVWVGAMGIAAACFLEAGSRTVQQEVPNLNRS